MKLNLEVDENTFKNQVMALREELKKSLESGILEDGFEKKLESLSQIEKNLLTELIPYYRVHEPDRTKTTYKIEQVEEVGGYSLDGFLQTVLKINNSLLIISSAGGCVQFCCVHGFDHGYNDAIQIEWGPPIKEINNSISSIHLLSKDELLLAKVGGGYYLLSGDFSDSIPVKLKIEEIPNSSDTDSFTRCLAIWGNTIIEENENELSLLKLKKENGAYMLEPIGKSCTIANVTVVKQISDNIFIAGTQTGELCVINWEKGIPIITDKSEHFQEKIRNISYLENEDGDNKNLMIIGDNHQMQILDLNLKQDKEFVSKNFFKGNLFDLQSMDGTAVVLSEDGVLYLAEENFKKWSFSSELTLENAFFTKVLALSSSKYLLMDLNNRWNLLDIDRIHTPQELWHLPLYQ